MASQRRMVRRQAIIEGGPEAIAAEAQRRYTNRMRSLYDMTRDDYIRMSVAQGGLCAICRLSPVGRGKGDRLVVDHCHTSDVVRELLCGSCNIAIGLFDDDPEIAVRAAEYLRKHQSAEPVAPLR